MLQPFSIILGFCVNIPFTLGLLCIRFWAIRWILLHPQHFVRNFALNHCSMLRHAYYNGTPCSTISRGFTTGFHWKEDVFLQGTDSAREMLSLWGVFRLGTTGKHRDDQRKELTMARREALLRLHKRLVSRRDSLRRLLAGELDDLGSKLRANQMGDTADAAFDTGVDEIASTLAELEAKELSQVELALTKLKQGTYGLCEQCEKKIPVERLNALPYSTMCISCQRENENSPFSQRGGFRSDWARVMDSGASLDEPKEVKLDDIEMDFSSHGR
jgi:DnaK suppressor protein